MAQIGKETANESNFLELGSDFVINVETYLKNKELNLNFLILNFILPFKPLNKEYCLKHTIFEWGDL